MQIDDAYGMKQNLRHLLYLVILLACCNGCITNQNKFPETFESGFKEGYAPGEIQLQSGPWMFNNALIGKSPKDHRNEHACVRMRGKASLEMRFDIRGHFSRVTISHALYGTDAPAKWQLLYSKDKGQSWHAAGHTITTSGYELQQAIFTIEEGRSVRLKLQKLGGGRLNIDDISLDDNEVSIQKDAEAATRDDNMALGNPSAASTASGDNLLVAKPQYTLSYNSSRGLANWVSWHLSIAWKGTTGRCNCFEADSDIPVRYYRAVTSDYIATGFDRGHLCPSDDRDGSSEDNAATFLMSNITPQAPNLNRDTWEDLESYCRKLITEGNELYIITGCYGSNGEGSKGTAGTIAKGAITVPARFWKVIVVLPVGNNDLQRIDHNTRIIAVDMPNVQTVNTYDWKHYRTTIDAIESATGYDLLSNVPADLQKVIEAKMDQGPGI